MAHPLITIPDQQGVFFLCREPFFWFFQSWGDVQNTQRVLADLLEKYEPQEAAPEAGGVEPQQPAVVDPPAGDPGVQAAPPLLETPEE